MGPSDQESRPGGEMGQKYLTSGKSVSMRLWEAEPPRTHIPMTPRGSETDRLSIAISTAPLLLPRNWEQARCSRPGKLVEAGALFDSLIRSACRPPTP